MCIDALVWYMWEKQSPKKNTRQRREIKVPGPLMCTELQQCKCLSRPVSSCWRLRPTGVRLGASPTKPPAETSISTPLWSIFLFFPFMLFQVFAFSCADGLSVAPHSENSFDFFFSFESIICVTQTTPQPTEHLHAPWNKFFYLKSSQYNTDLITVGT